MKLIRKISGIRGLVGKTLNDKVVYNHSKSFSQIQPDGPILIAQDTRSHGSHFSKISINAILETGRDVYNYQIIPTPTAQFIVSKNNYAGAIVITASHNPIEWNGMKFINSDGCFLNEQQNNLLFNQADNLVNDTKNLIGKLTTINDGFIEHIQHTVDLSIINKNQIKRKKLKVVVDAVNGAASYAIPKLLTLLNCNVIPLFCSPDGKFPHSPEPLNKNLKSLCTSVIVNKADLGIAIDPDGDRLAIIDDKGKPLGEENTLVIASDNVLSNGLSTKIVSNLSTTMGLDTIASKYNAEVIRSKVGEINVVEKMKEVNSKFGGEGNGGIILKESHLGRDAIVGTAIILDWLSKKNGKLSELRLSLPDFSIIKDKINLEDINPDQALKILSSNFNDATKDKTDGLKLIWEDKWIHIRKSNTEPILRIYSESKNISDAKNLIDDVKKYFY